MLTSQITDQEYHDDESNWGNYAYVTLKEVIDELLMETIDGDNLLAGTKRSLLLLRAKNGIQELSREVKKTILMFEMEIGPKLYIPLPKDYMDWVRVSVLDSDFKMHPLSLNLSMNTVAGYLQNQDFELLFDDDGCVLTADSGNVYNKPYNRYEVCPGEGAGDNGQFIIDKARGTIVFSSNLEEKNIVMEYISDGMNISDCSETEVRIHKDLKQVLIAYVYYYAIHRRKNVRLQDKRDALQRYKALLHEAKLDDMCFNITDLNRTVTPKTTEQGKQTTNIYTTQEAGWFAEDL